jgi:hypothetical protein
MKRKLAGNTTSGLSNENGILSSLIYLKSEIRNSGLPRTEKAIEDSLRAFFTDLEAAGKLDKNLELIQQFLAKALLMPDGDLDQLIKLINFFDASEDDAACN